MLRWTPLPYKTYSDGLYNVFNRRKKVIQVRNNMRVSKMMTEYYFCLNYPWVSHG